MKQDSVDKPLLISVIILLIAGLFIFSSAALGLLARDGASYSSIALSRAVFGIFLGGLLAFIASRIHYRQWRKWAFFIFIFSLFATALVFVPNIGIEHGGAKRWINLGAFSFQTSELLKIAYLIYLAAWISSVRQKISTWKHGILPFFIISAITGGVLLAQPDTDTFMILVAAGLAMLFASGASWRHIGLIVIVCLLGFTVLIFTKPYIKERVMTYINPGENALGSSYQIQQSFIAIGSGQIFGRGFGQSVQKFNFLPEPIGDSIFAVMAEEFGFMGSVTLIIFFLFFGWRGLKIALKAPDTFGGLLALGIVILILSQSFINMGAMLGILPLSGIPLLFVSHGGSALMMTLAEIGILLNISRFKKTE